MTRPGSILELVDRVVYQALVDQASTILEEQMDRTRSFSHVKSAGGPNFFVPSQECWEKFQHEVQELCNRNEYILKTDIANYFETINQHNLINLMSASGVNNSVIKLLEEQLLAFRQRYSFGIIQGIYPSDMLGNYYLTEFDSECALHDWDSARYVDDIYIGFNTKNDAHRVLVRIAERLRANGLALNEHKTSIIPAHIVLDEEREVDILFDAAREEIREEIEDIHQSGYGFQEDWMDEEEDDDFETEVRLSAVSSLLAFNEENQKQREKIDRFCFPILRAAASDLGVDAAMRGFLERPQLARLYASYPTRFTKTDVSVVRRVETLIQQDDFVTDYERMYAAASIMTAQSVSERTVNKVLRWMEAATVEAETRAICAIFAAKHGNANQKSRVKLRYESEDSEYVRAAIMFASQYFPTAQKKSARLALGSHNDINSMIAEAIR